KSAQIREILISESAWEEMTCLFAPSLIECGDKLNQYQIIKYCIRVFVDRDIKERVTPEIIYKINEIVVKQIALLN
ncbi:hypothetical protein V6140_16770, partial [Klebsiella pneumoniae]